MHYDTPSSPCSNDVNCPLIELKPKRKSSAVKYCNVQQLLYKNIKTSRYK